MVSTMHGSGSSPHMKSPLVFWRSTLIFSAKGDFKNGDESSFLLSNTMPPRSKTKRHENGALETMFRVQAQPANAPTPVQPGPRRNTRRRATVEDANDDDRLPLMNAAVPCAAQSVNIPAPAQPGPSRHTRRRATVEDADDDDHPPRPNATQPSTAQPANMPAPAQPRPNSAVPPMLVNATGSPPATQFIHVTFDRTPQCRRHQDDPVEDEMRDPVPGRTQVPDSPVVAPLPSAIPDPQTPHNPHPSSPVSKGEQFPMPSSSSSEDTPRTGTTPRMSRGTPRAGPHSPNRRRAVHAPAGNKQ
ncbi:hypothetical protein BDZ97DRAFT_1753834 [Flammula alnicola]|nr:hypothetical protein BDZ97DRAFT_1753834 [Flammula alnicola]